jgi:hypothetical protein
MRNIQSVNVWKDGTVKTVTKLKVTTVFDNLENIAGFLYQLYQTVILEEDTLDLSVIEGTVEMSPLDYISWDRSIIGTYGYVAGKLNLTILP